jgi:Spy/CpxP family protein refolding chaperone
MSKRCATFAAHALVVLAIAASHAAEPATDIGANDTIFRNGFDSAN